jgi:TRAP transporter TAXI family solute receptor
MTVRTAVAPAWAVLLVVLAACGGRPDGDAVRADVSRRLAQAMPDGAVTLAEFHRRGSQGDAKAPVGETRRIVYFDADLTVTRDVDLGAWDSPGVAGIVSALGAGPKGIVGITAGGNRAGDVIRAHGTAVYRSDGARWMPVASGGFRPATAPAYATNGPPDDAATTLEALRTMIESVPAASSPVQRAAIEQELVAAQAAIRARLARATDGYAIAAGPEHGQYLRFARALPDGEGVRTVPLVTRGGEDNLRLLREGRVSLALAQGDAALAAYEGTGSFTEVGPHTGLRAIGSLYPEPVHVLVRRDSPAASAADLGGRRVVVGPPGSASRTTALRVLEAHGLTGSDVTPVGLSLDEGLIALRERRVDAVVQVIGVPADRVRVALAETPLRLLPLSERAVARLVETQAGYFAFTIPRGAYATQDGDVRTIATAALLVVGSGLSESEVAALTRYVYEKGRDLAARGSAQGVQVAPPTARQGLPIPLHVAAAGALARLTSREPGAGVANRNSPHRPARDDPGAIR